MSESLLIGLCIDPRLKPKWVTDHTSLRMSPFINSFTSSQSHHAAISQDVMLACCLLMRGISTSVVNPRPLWWSVSPDHPAGSHVCGPQPPRGAFVAVAFACGRVSASPPAPPASCCINKVWFSLPTRVSEDTASSRRVVKEGICQERLGLKGKLFPLSSHFSFLNLCSVVFLLLFQISWNT